MSIWSGIKYALNSRIGKKDMIPLDKLFFSLRQIAASDDIYISIWNRQNHTATIYGDMFTSPKAQILCSGTVKLKVAANVGRTWGIVFSLYRNGKKIDLNGNPTDETVTLYSDTRNDGQDSNGDYFLLSSEISVEPYDTFWIELCDVYSGSAALPDYISRTSFHSFSILATEVEVPPYRILN